MTLDDQSGVTRRRFLASSGAAAALIAGCQEQVDERGGDGSDGSDGTATDSDGDVIVKGSSTVFPISDRMAEEFMAENPENVTVDSTGSGGGFENWFCPGDADINGASRPITEGEQEQCSSNDVSPVEFEIAGDALTVAVNNDADWVDCLTFDELSQIWREDGAETWSDVREGWPDREFELFGPADTSGTYDWFNGNVVGEDTRHTTDHQPTEEDEQIVQGIQDNEAGMGYFGYAYYSENSDLVKAVEIRESEGDECTSPGLENAQDGSYPMARPLYIYAAESALQRDAVYDFVQFYVEEAETDVIRDVGYVPSSAEQRDENLGRLEEVAE